MKQLKILRVMHALLALGTIWAYFTEHPKINHIWLGYSVVALIVVRLIIAATMHGQLGLFRFYPHFAGLKLGNLTTHPAISKMLLSGIAISLLTTVGSGLMMDQGRNLSKAPAWSAFLSFGEGEEEDEHDDHRPGMIAMQEEHDDASEGEVEDDEEESIWGEVHELAANLLVGLVVAHVSYLLLHKRQLALFMLFFDRKKKKTA